MSTRQNGAFFVLYTRQNEYIFVLRVGQNDKKRQTIKIACVISEDHAGEAVSADRLPKDLTAFITKHFPGDAVVKAETDQGRRGTIYEIDLKSGIEIDVLEDGNWKEVKAPKGSAVPAAFVLEAIAAYVEKNYTGKTISEISRQRGCYELNLSDGTELRLTEDAQPLADKVKGQRGDRGNRGNGGNGGNRPRR